MKDNLDKGVWVNLGNVYIGTVKELVDLPRDKWEKERWRILTASGVEVTGADHQYSKLAFTSHIDKLKGIKRMSEIKKTSKEWYREAQKKSYFIILDPDGWDRTNFDYSFNQQRITEKEFKQRVVRSTTQGRLPND